MSYLVIRPLPCCTLCPYTTLFRSPRGRGGGRGSVRGQRGDGRVAVPAVGRHERERADRGHVVRGELRVPPRSEEHTSELQSRLHLVCRLLLEKKNKIRCPLTSMSA